MNQTLKLWQELGIVADGIQTGWLGNAEQIPLIRKMSEVLTHDGTVILIDPVMGDGFGEGSIIYSRPRIAEEISNLTRVADIITPNLTEAAILLGKEPKECGVTDNGTIDIGLAKDLAAELALIHPGLVILKSVLDENEPNRIGVCMRFTGDNAMGIGLHPTTRVVFADRVGSGTGGTGDAFATLVMGQWLRQAMGKRGDQESVCDIIQISMGIISDSLRAIQNEEGLKFLPALARQVNRVFWR
ncbi:bifunctional hydroxymethylpyrimidine kinase/phosphomethylpyrimidine kinase [Candidatus Daviesbacteria bacterium]|nr:bifunctional hydroxymethylpyrimidine kinase/phosphomethylpyrimidine kinase [Candidatus Daviesbacteria bacterium]